MRRAAVAAGLLWAGAAAAQDPGEAAFQKCYACHSVDPAEGNLTGPNLAGIVGRRAGTIAGFEYSDAMRKAADHGLVWDAAALDRFIADPEGTVPGTAMAFPGLKSEAERHALIGYLVTHR